MGVSRISHHSFFEIIEFREIYKGRPKWGETLFIFAFILIFEYLKIKFNWSLNTFIGI